MGFFDRFVEMIDSVKQAAEAALEYARKLAEEAQRKVREATEEAERVAKGVANKVEATAKAVQGDLERLTPSFDEKLQQIMDEVKEVASVAAEEGVDITEAVNSAVEIALKKVEDALNAAIDAVNRFLWEAKETLFGFLKGVLPDWLDWVLNPVKAAIEWALKGLQSFGDKLKQGISYILEKIKGAVQAFVKKVGEVLGPIWKFLKWLWRMLFGVEPEQCALAAQWFEERMRRTEQQLLYKCSSEPVSALIRKHTYLELLPPDENSWKTLALEFLDRPDTVPAWSAHRARMSPLLTSTKPKPGAFVQLTWDEPYTDALGGRQRVQISVLYFRWKTEEFRKVTAGFLGILAMASAVETQSKPYVQPPPVLVRRDQPLRIDSAMSKKIYDEMAPHIRDRPMHGYQAPVGFTGTNKGESRQLKFRDDNGVWRTPA